VRRTIAENVSEAIVATLLLALLGMSLLVVLAVTASLAVWSTIADARALRARPEPSCELHGERWCDECFDVDADSYERAWR
jgi:hypothetical protein